MLKNVSKRAVAFLLVAVMMLGMIPMTVFAQESAPEFEEFVENLRVLEVYAAEYGAAVHRDEGELILNFIRTGVDRYQDDNWETLAGEEITGFTQYVQAQDAACNTTAMELRDIEAFKLPNGNKVDFGHMFGCMNISYINKGSADLSGWAGDLCDLLRYCVEQGDITGSVEEMAAYIRKNCFGVDASEAFGWDDFWGDLDAYYLVTEYQKFGGNKTFSEIMEAYFTKDLNDTDRTVYFMNNRFGVEDTQAAVRKAIYNAYSSDVGIKILESKRGLSSYNALREACCYAIADYIYENAKGKLIEGNGGGATAENGYYSVFSDTESILAPGIKQNIKYAQTVDGKQIVYYVATVDVKRDDVMLKVNYKDNDPSKGWGMQTVADQVAAMVKNYKDKYEYFTPVVATNGDGYNIYNGMPAGLLVMDGKEWHGVDHDGFFAIISTTDEHGNQVDKAIIGTQEEYAQYKDQIKEAIGGFGAVLVKDGKINVTKNPNYTASRASRTAIGITADGEVVMMVMDGRQQPFSAGGSMEEIAQVMLEAGCVHAINLDGGGSTTYLSKPAGGDSIQLTNRPSDGYQRLVAASLVAISTAKPSNEFDSAIISSDYEYITAGTSMQFSVTGVSNTGNAATIPADATWRVSDDTLASIDENGLFTAAWSEEAPVTGDVTVEFVVDGKVVGSKVIHIVIPDDIKFVEDRITAIYGVPKEIAITVWYQGKQVAFTADEEVFIMFENYEFQSDAGYFEGLTFYGLDEFGIRSATIMAVLLSGEDIIASVYSTINLYYKDEATFDFDNATSGNRSLAWLREIENARSTDNKLYRVIDPTKPIKVDYTFALDMTAIEMPAQLEPLKSMLPDGTNPDADAWDFLLSLAERICVQTNVTIRAEFSPELDVDISNLKVLTDYFELTSANLDANNVLTLVCNWKDQTQSIDPATANPLCLLAGITATVKDTASYFNNEVVITNNGTVTYDIYLATSALHSFASDPENQAKYGLYPFEHSDDKYPTGCRGDDHDMGGHFSSQYLDFADVYVVDKEILEGWQEDDGDYYFYKNNVPVTGTQLVTDRHDANKLRFYEFDEDGKLVDEQGANGLVWLGEDLYYAVLGEAWLGWREIDGKNYYFDPDTGKAVDGVVKIREKQNPAVADGKTPTVEYTYTFTDHVLTLGAWVYDTNIIGNDKKKHTGWRYRWANDWKDGWFEVQGEYYFANKDYPNMVYTGFVRIMKQDAVTADQTQYHLFDERGTFQKDFTGVHFDGSNYHYVKNGVREIAKGVYEAEGYYYYGDGSGVLCKNTTVSINSVHTNGHISGGSYEADQYGRLQVKLISENIINPGEGTGAQVQEILGRVVTLTAPIACKVLYKDAEGKYHVIEAKVNPYGTATLAQESSTEYNFIIPKEATEVQILVSGDIGGNGTIDESDVQGAVKAFMGGEGLSDVQMYLADVDGDGKITAADIAYIKAVINKGIKLDW